MESSKRFDGSSREFILNLAREFADEQIGAVEERDLSQVGEFFQRITDLFMEQLKKSGQGEATESLHSEIVHEFQLKCDQAQKSQIEKIGHCSKTGKIG